MVIPVTFCSVVLLLEMGRIMGVVGVEPGIMPILIFSCEAVEPDSHPIDPNARIMC